MNEIQKTDSDQMYDHYELPKAIVRCLIPFYADTVKLSSVAFCKLVVGIDLTIFIHQSFWSVA